jgi:hypothetical protein
VKLDETAHRGDAPTNEKTEVAEPASAELADPVASKDIVEAIESALTGYDEVIGDPINVVDKGTVKDPGLKKHIFKYDPNDERKMLQIGTQTGCSSKRDSSVISTVKQFREEVAKEAEIAGSVSGSGMGVSASFAFSASVSSNKVEEKLAKEHGSMTIFTMTCSSKNLDVGDLDTGLPPFQFKFANFIIGTLGKVNPGNKGQEKAKFKSLLDNYGTDYVNKAVIGARVTTTNYISKTMTESTSQSKIKACASASASFDYMGAVSGEVSASGCSAKDRSDFNSNDKGVEDTIKNSYGTTKVAGDGTNFNMDQMKEPRPIKFSLKPITELFTPNGLKYGIPDKYGDAADPSGAKRKALSAKILSWLGPMFKRENFEKNYCEAFKHKLPNCGKVVTNAAQKKCGYEVSCGQGKECVDTNTAPYYTCDSLTKKIYSGATIGHWGKWGKMDKCQDGNYVTAFKLKSEGHQKSGDDTGLNRVIMYCNGASGHETSITSSYKSWGAWGARRNCPGTDNAVTGFRIKIEPMQGRGSSDSTDDTSANTVDLRCENGATLTGDSNSNWGDWSSWVMCPSGKAVVGIQTRVESFEGEGDDTAINGMKLLCKTKVKRDEPVLEKDEPVLKKDEPVLEKDEPVLKKDEPSKQEKLVQVIADAVEKVLEL